MDVRLPDGTVIRNVPEGTTRAQLVQKLQSNGMNVPKEWMATARPLPKDEPIDPTEGMSGTDKFLSGVGKSMVDVVRGVRQYLPESVGGLTNEQIAEARALDAPLMRTGAGMAGNVAGNVAMAVPAAFVPGAATVPGAALVGAGYGALQPGVNAGERLTNAAIGGVASAALPVVVRAGQVAKSFIDPLYQGGRDKIVGGAIRRAAGNQADEAMRNMRSASEIVPGSAPTAAEAANVPGVAALQRTATALDPIAMNALVARQSAQNEARIAALRNVSGDAESLAALREARDDAANVAYQRARNSDAMRRELLAQEAMAKQKKYAGLGSLGNVPNMTDAQAIAGAIRPSKALEDLSKRPAFQSLINQAKTLAANKGIDIGNPMTSIDGLHYIKIALDDALEFNPQNPLGRNAKSALMGIKEKLLSEMDNISPVYGISREAYAQSSKPITQMQIGQELEKAINPLTGVLQPKAYARALDDKAAQRVTRMAGSTLQSTVEPAALQSLQSIKDDLARSNFAQNAGRPVGSDTVQKLAFNNILQQSGIPSAVQGFAPAGVVGNVAQRLGQIAYRDNNEAMAQQLARALLDPQSAAQLMEAAATNPSTAALIQGLRRGGAAIGSSAPALIQSNQQ